VLVRRGWFHETANITGFDNVVWSPSHMADLCAANRLEFLFSIGPRSQRHPTSEE